VIRLEESIKVDAKLLSENTQVTKSQSIKCEEITNIITQKGANCPWLDTQIQYNKAIRTLKNVLVICFTNMVILKTQLESSVQHFLYK